MWFAGQWGCWVETAQSRCGLTVQLYNLSHKYTPAHIHFELKMYILKFLKEVLSCHELQAYPAIRAQRVEFGSSIENKTKWPRQVRELILDSEILDVWSFDEKNDG